MLDEFRSTDITWDKATRRIYSPISANESDSNGRKLNIQVVNSGQVENLAGATLHLYWETKDKAQHGLDAFTASDITKGEFEIFYTTGMLSNVGELNATLVLVDNTGQVVSDWFKITVVRGIDDDAIQSENSFTTLTQALIDISNLEQNYTPRLNDLTAQLQQIKNKHYILNSNNLSNETSRIQAIIDKLVDGDSLELRGTFNIRSLPVLNKENIKIFGNGTLNCLTGVDIPAFFNFAGCKNITIEGLSFIGLKNKIGAPTTYTVDTNAIIRINSTSNIKITGCKFFKHIGHWIDAIGVGGYWSEDGFTIENCWFEEAGDIGSNEQTVIHLGHAAQYSNIINNTFKLVKSAIHCYGANNRIKDNNIINNTLDVTYTTIDDLINAKQAHILVAVDGTNNQAKNQVIGNKINHAYGSCPAIMVLGETTRNENYNMIKDNELLVNEYPYAIILDKNSGTQLDGNVIGRNPNANLISHLYIRNSEQILLDGNHFYGNNVVSTLDGAEIYEGHNTRRFVTDAKNYIYVTNATRGNKRFAKENIGFAFIANGTLSGWLSNLVGVSTIKNSTGNYTVNHGLGHANYVVQATTESNNGIIQIASRTSSSFNVIVVDHAGSLIDTTVIGDIKVVGKNGYHNAEVCKW